MNEETNRMREHIEDKYNELSAVEQKLFKLGQQYAQIKEVSANLVVSL